eukprot:c27284_g1_i1 orf=2-202(-)
MGFVFLFFGRMYACLSFKLVSVVVNHNHQCKPYHVLGSCLSVLLIIEDGFDLRCLDFLFPAPESCKG